MTAADICRERGWGKGTTLEIVARGFTSVEHVTAVGEQLILYKRLGHKWNSGDEWTVLDGPFEQTGNPFEAGADVTALDRLPWEVPDATA